MEAFAALPVWAQLLLVFLVAAVLIVMNVGWLIQARGWLERQKQQQASRERRGGSPPTAPRSNRDGA